MRNYNRDGMELGSDVDPTSSVNQMPPDKFSHGTDYKLREYRQGPNMLSFVAWAATLMCVLLGIVYSRQIAQWMHS